MGGREDGCRQGGWEGGSIGGRREGGTKKVTDGRREVEWGPGGIKYRTDGRKLGWVGGRGGGGGQKEGGRNTHPHP